MVNVSITEYCILCIIVLYRHFNNIIYVLQAKCGEAPDGWTRRKEDIGTKYVEYGGRVKSEHGNCDMVKYVQSDHSLTKDILMVHMLFIFRFLDSAKME